MYSLGRVPTGGLLSSFLIIGWCGVYNAWSGKGVGNVFFMVHIGSVS